MKCYYGEIHSHTVESDGMGTPEEAYDYARDVGQVDFFAVTDHHQYLKTDRFAEQMPALAQKKSQDGKFVALYGYEMSYSANTGYYGHLNLYGEPYVHPKTIPLSQWYDRIAESGRAVTGQFNHPGEKWGDFEEFAYDARIDKIFDLIELRIDEYGIPVIEEEYERCLSKGWHVGPLSNEDTHRGNFTTAREEVGAVLAEELSVGAITDAMKHRRTFATTDGTFRIFYRANGHWMGDVIEKAGELNISVECSTEKECGIGILQLVGERNTVLAQIDAERVKNFTWNVRLPDGHKYVYVRRMCGTHYAVTAPVWVEQPRVAELSLETSFCKDGTAVQVEIKNISGKDIEAINLDYYTCNGRITHTHQPSRHFQTSLSAAFPLLEDRFVQQLDAAQDRVTVAVSGVCGGIPFYLSKVVYVCPIGITQVFVNAARDTSETSENAPAEQFNCFDVYNFSDAECDLSDYTIRTYPLHIPCYDDVIINRTLAPHRTLTVWFRTDASLGTVDFNRAFGTSLREEDLYPVKVSFPFSTGARKLLICYGDRTVSRTWLREGKGAKLPQIEPFSAFIYQKNADGYTSKCTGYNIRSVPKGTFDGTVLTLDKKRNKGNPTLEVGKLLCLCDGGDTEEEIRARSLQMIGKEPNEILLGSNNRNTWLDAYFRREGEALLIKAGASDADTVALMIGGNDCGRGNSAWLDGSNIAMPIVCQAVCLYLIAKGKQVILLTPVSAYAYPDDRIRLQRGLDAVCRTVSAAYCDAERLEIAEFLTSK